MKYTIYQITNLIDGKTYIGCHKTDNIDDGYMGSGKYLRNAIEKYGIENFQKDILGVFGTSEEMFHMESVLVNEEFVRSVDTYNLKIGGFGGFDYINENCGNQGTRLNESLSNEKRRLGGKNSRITERVQEMRKDPEFDKRFRESCGNTFRGKKHSEESKQRIGVANSIHQKGSGNSQYGTMWITNEVESKKIRKDEEIPEGWRKGRKFDGLSTTSES